jgi:tetratricopeptide (TPR) repeat protein
MTVASQRRAWLYGPLPDLFFGCGAGSILMMSALAIWGTASLSRLVPVGLMILLFSLPHYGATLVRVYESQENRRRYAFVAWWVSAGLAALFLLSLHSPLLGSLLLTLYLTWSPWHYTGQNYGIASMMLGRRGVQLSQPVRRALRYSFWLSYGLTFLAMHGVERAANYTPVPYGGSVYHLMPIGLPAAFASVALVVTAVAYLGVLLFAAAGILRAPGSSLRRVAPCFLLMLTQSLWFALPVLARYGGGLSAESQAFANVYTAYGFLWIAAAHAVQYLWITSYYHGIEEGEVEVSPVVQRARYLAKAAFGGFAIWIVPVVVFAPGYLGSLPAESGLALMVAAIVNLHHFILDGAIWKLRDESVSRVLIDAEAGEHPWTERRGRLAPAIYALGALALLVNLSTWWEGEHVFQRTLVDGDLGRSRTALSRLAWLGADGPSRHVKLGRRLAAKGDAEQARFEFQASIALQPNTPAWRSLALLQEERGEWKQAIEAYSMALEVDADDVQALYRSGLAWLRLDEPDRARSILEQAAALAPGDRGIAAALERARRRGTPPPH